MKAVVEKLTQLSKSIEKLNEKAEKALKAKNVGSRATAVIPPTFSVKPVTTVEEILKSEDPKLKPVREAADNLYLMSVLSGRDPRTLPYWDVYMKTLQKAIDMSTGTGAEWVPTYFSTEMIERIELELKVAKLFPIYKTDSPKYHFMQRKGTLSAYLVSAATQITEESLSNYTGEVTGTTNKIAVYLPVADEVVEGNPSALQLVKDDIAHTIAAAIENAIINGDDSDSHMDSDVTSATDPRKAWKGLRKLVTSSAKKDAGNTAPDTTDLRAVRKAMGKYGVDPNDLAWVVGPAGYYHLMNLEETKTVDKYGPDATIKTGKIVTFDGIEVVPSGYVRENLNASGVYDGTTTDRTVILLVNKRAFMLVWLRQIKLESARNIRRQATELVGVAELDFVPRIASTETIVGMLYNVPS